MSQKIHWAALDYQQQLDKKVSWLKELISPWTDFKPDVYNSPEHSYRMRAEFRIWHEGEDTDYAMYEAGTKKHIPLMIFHQQTAQFAH